MSINLKLRREVLGVSAAKLADIADVEFGALLMLESGGVGTERTIRKVFEAIGKVQHRPLTPNEQEHLLKEQRDPVAAAQEKRRFEEGEATREERKEKARAELYQAAKMREMGM